MESYPSVRGGSSVRNEVVATERQPVIPVLLQQLEHKLAMLSSLLDEHEKKIDHVICRRPEPPGGELTKTAPDEPLSQVAENLRAALRSLDSTSFRLRHMTESVQL